MFQPQLQGDDREDEVVVAERHGGGGGQRAAGPPQPVGAEAGDGKEAGLARLGGVRDVVDPHPGAELVQAPGVLAQLLAEVLRLVQVLLAGGVVRLVGDQQDPVAELQVQRPGAGRRRHVGHRFRLARVPDIDHAEAARERVRDEGVALVQHDLQRVGAARDVAGSEQLHPVAGHQKRMLTLLSWV
jgi:hypothetical protein